jgi:hypothetical protein
MKATIKGIQDAQYKNLKMIAALKPRGRFGRAVLGMTIEAYRYVVTIAHVDTGANRAAQRMIIENGGLRGRIYIDPAAVNPKGKRPAMYGPVENARGGNHAFYGRVQSERGVQISRAGAEMIARDL